MGGFNMGGAMSGAMSGATMGSSISPGWGTAIGAVLGAVGGATEKKPGGGPTIGGQQGTPSPQTNIESFAPGSFGPPASGTPSALQPQFHGSGENLNPLIREQMLKQLIG